MIVVFCFGMFYVLFFLLQPFQQSEKPKVLFVKCKPFYGFFYAGGDLLLGGDSGLMCYVLKGKLEKNCCTVVECSVSS